jgi:hypothetical protein
MMKYESAIDAQERVLAIEWGYFRNNGEKEMQLNNWSG